MSLLPRLLIFAKAPIPGQVKTRLIPALGVQGATALYSRLLEITLDAASRVPGMALELWCAPSIDHPELGHLAQRHGATLHAQHGQHLGERMLHAQQAAAHAGPNLLIGTDCPDLNADDLLAARNALNGEYDLVFTPTRDGGYILIGAQRPVPEVLGALDWGTDQVMPQTRALLRQHRLRWLELPAKRDIDRPADLADLPQTWLKELSLPRTFLDCRTMDYPHES